MEEFRTLPPVEGPTRGTEAAGLRVVVRGSPDDEASSADEAMRRRRRVKRLRITVPLAVIALVVDGVAGVDQGTGVWVVVAAIAAGFAITPPLAWLVLRSRSSRWRSIEGVLWVSHSGTFLGPYDEETGLSGSMFFHLGHLRPPSGPVVRMVVTANDFQLVATVGEEETLSCRLGDAATVDVRYGGPVENGVTITTKDGRAASVALHPNQALVEALVKLGATVGTA